MARFLKGNTDTYSGKVGSVMGTVVSYLLSEQLHKRKNPDD